MFVLGLTGSIGMGKSETARMFRRLGVPVWDADEAVRALYAAGGEAVPLIETEFPGCTKNGAVDRPALGAAVLGDTPKLKRLEAIVHPLVAKYREAFLHAQAMHGRPVVVLDIPLLYETGAEAQVDAVAVVSAPPDVQRARVNARPGMTPERFAAIGAQQLPDVEKRRRADFVIETGKGLDYALHQVRAVLADVSSRSPRAWQERRQGG